MSATINTTTGIKINGTVYSVFGVFGDEIGTHVAATGETRNFFRSEAYGLIDSGAAELVPVCEFCGSPDVVSFDLGAAGSMSQCRKCAGVVSDDIEGKFFDILFREKGTPTSDAEQSFRCAVRGTVGHHRMRGMARGGVIVQWG